MRVLVKILFATMLLIATAFVLGVGPFKVEYQLAYSIDHIVKPRETLWSIANQFYALQDKDDVRDLIDDIRLNNSIKANEHIQPGQLLLIPIYKKK